MHKIENVTFLPDARPEHFFPTQTSIFLKPEESASHHKNSKERKEHFAL